MLTSRLILGVVRRIYWILNVTAKTFNKATSQSEENSLKNRKCYAVNCMRIFAESRALHY